MWSQVPFLICDEKGKNNQWFCTVLRESVRFTTDQIKALLWLSTLLGEKHYDVSSKKFESERNAIV